MSRLTLFTVFATALIFSALAKADNALTNDQLVKSIQVALADYASGDPEMSKSISGLRSSTVGGTASVTIEMNADGMKMSAKYLCAPRAAEMACRLQQ